MQTIRVHIITLLVSYYSYIYDEDKHIDTPYKAHSIASWGNLYIEG